jgi:hypothetical protein
MNAPCFQSDERKTIAEIDFSLANNAGTILSANNGMKKATVAAGFWLGTITPANAVNAIKAPVSRRRNKMAGLLAKLPIVIRWFSAWDHIRRDISSSSAASSNPPP